jgi:hypothetical protein
VGLSRTRSVENEARRFCPAGAAEKLATRIPQGA